MERWTKVPITPQDNLTMLLYAAEVFLNFVRYREINRGYEQRPVYNIGHMVNSIQRMDWVMSQGANGVQIDVEFLPNGTATDAHFAYYCNCLREQCDLRTPLEDMLGYIRETTQRDPNRYARVLALVVLYLQVDKIPFRQKYLAGMDIGYKIVHHLWRGVSRWHARNVVVSVNYASDITVIDGVNHTISQHKPTFYNRIGYDARDETDSNKRWKLYSELGMPGNYWQGSGVSTCTRKDVPTSQLQSLLDERDTLGHPIHKVYQRTVDLEEQMIDSLNRGVDAIVTNKPGNLRFVLDDWSPPILRLAEPEDNPWQRFDAWAPLLRLPPEREVHLGDDVLEYVPGVDD